MKTLILTALSALLVTSLQAQVTFTIVSPPAVAGGYNFTSNGDGTDWGLADLLDPADAILDTCVLAEDGTPGINAQGVPFSNEACGPLTNNVTGKIAVLYRYDGVSSNVCWYGTKVLNAQNAGAVGVIMINRDDNLIDVPGTTDGPSTTIPFAFISKSDGALLRAAIENGDDVVAFLGNKLGIYANDGGLVKSSTIAPRLSATSSITSQNATEFGFDVGASVYNFGNQDQSNVSITATVNGPAGTWTETAGPYTILAGDTLDVYTGGTNNINAFSFASYPNGRYTLDYSVDLGVTDDSDFDNSISYEFVISDSMVSYGFIDSASNRPIPSANYRASNSGIFETCINYDNPNGSRVAVEGMYFSSVTGYNSGVTLDGEEIPITLYSWDDPFTDLNDAALDFASLTPLAYGYYYYPSDLQGEVVYAAFDNHIQLTDNQRYLACLQINNPDIYVGHDTKIDYTSTIGHYLQPQTPNRSDNGYFALGFGEDLSPAIALKVFDASELSVSQHEAQLSKVYPNPATDELTVVLKDNTAASISILDLSGREIISIKDSSKITNNVNIQGLNSGQYIISIMYSGGIKERFKIVKQ